MKAALFFPNNAFIDQLPHHNKPKDQQQRDDSAENPCVSVDIKNHYAAIRIQCLFRMVAAKRKVDKIKRNNPKYVTSKAAVLIQRVFRGFLGRAIVKNIERRKLLKFLRNWSHGKTGNLFHISGKFEVTKYSRSSNNSYLF